MAQTCFQIMLQRREKNTKKRFIKILARISISFQLTAYGNNVRVQRMRIINRIDYALSHC